MAEEARKGQGKGKGKGANEGYHPFKGKGKGQAKAGKGKGQGKEPAQASAVRLDPVLETAYQLYLSGRRPEQPRVSRNAWLRNNMRSDSTIRAELRGRMQAAHNAPMAGAKPAAAPKGESVTTTPRLPPPPPKPRPRGYPGVWDPQSTATSSTEPPPKATPPAQAVSSSTSSSSEQQEVLPEASPWARRTARKTTSAKHAEHAQHKSLAPVEAAQWTWKPDPCSSEANDTAQQLPVPEEVGATPQKGFSLDAVASALQHRTLSGPLEPGKSLWV